MVGLIDKSGCTVVESREGLVETCPQRNISVGQEPGTFDLQMAGLFQTFPTTLLVRDRRKTILLTDYIPRLILSKTVVDFN